MDPPELIFRVETEIYGPLGTYFLKYKERLNIWTPVRPSTVEK